ncbi:MAG TPA: hypothetical protein VFM88_22425 [Vicinamibacteria bacterium]|nr:hypothetical protein [Vicinamibacteria bacterium]
MRPGLGLLAALALGCGAAGPSATTTGTTSEPVAAACPPEAAELSGGWLAAVDRGDELEALRLAEALAPAAVAALAEPPSAYVEAFARARTDPAFLTRPFNHWDYQSWSHARFFSLLAAEIAAGTADEDRALFAAVASRLRDPDPPDPGALWPYRIWQTGRGFCDRQAWVLAELAYQRGSDSKIVYLYDPGTDVSPHTIAQIRTRGRPTAADPFTERALYGVSVFDVATSPGLAQALWPGNRRFQRAIGAAKLWVPSYPQDYARRNQVLSERLTACLGAASPRFGEDPNRRMSVLPAETEGLPLGLWHYPVRILAWEMHVAPH